MHQLSLHLLFLSYESESGHLSPPLDWGRLRRTCLEMIHKQLLPGIDGKVGKFELLRLSSSPASRLPLYAGVLSILLRGCTASRQIWLLFTTSWRS